MPRVSDWRDCASRAATTAHWCTDLADTLLVTAHVMAWAAKDAVRRKCWVALALMFFGSSEQSLCASSVTVPSARRCRGAGVARSAGSLVPKWGHVDVAILLC